MPYWTEVKRSDFDRACDQSEPKWTELNRTEPNRKNVWAVKIAPLRLHYVIQCDSVWASEIEDIDIINEWRSPI